MLLRHVIFLKFIVSLWHAAADGSICYRACQIQLLHWEKWPCVRRRSESHEHTSLNTEVVPITKVNYLMSVSQNQVSNPDLRSSNKMNLSLEIWITLIRKGAHTWTHKGRKLNLGQCKKHTLWWKKSKGEQARVRREIRSIT